MYTICFILAMAVPIALLLVGIMWRVKPPAFQATGFAYRTVLTMKSPDAWAFAHRHCAKLWIRIGVILGVIATVLMVVFKESYAKFLLWLIGGQMVFFCISAFLVDTLLKNLFDEDGNPME